MNKAVTYLEPYYPESALPNLLKIQPTHWYDNKTEALDWSAPFVWLDDFAFDYEKEALRKRNRFESLLLVDLNQPGELNRIREQIITMAGDQ